MNAKKRVAIYMMCLFLLSISTASAYIEPRTPYIIESSVEGITEDENGNIIITEHGCLFEVNTTFHYRYGFEKILFWLLSRTLQETHLILSIWILTRPAQKKDMQKYG